MLLALLGSSVTVVAMLYTIGTQRLDNMMIMCYNNNTIGKRGNMLWWWRSIQKICAQRSWGKADLLRYHYTKMKMREYDEQKIKEAREKKENK